MEVLGIIFGFLKELLSLIGELLKFLKPGKNGKRKPWIIVLGIVLLFAMIVFFTARSADTPNWGTAESNPGESEIVQTVPSEMEASDEERAALIVSDAKKCMDARDYLKALSILEDGLAGIPGSTVINEALFEVRDCIEKEINSIILEAQELAESGEYDTATALVKQGINIYGEDARFDEKLEECRLGKSIITAKQYVEQGNYEKALKILGAELDKYPLDVEIVKLYGECETAYISDIINSVDELLLADKYDEAVAAINKAITVVPENAELLAKNEYLKENKPVPIIDTSISEQHSPNNTATGVYYGNWEADRDLDITMNRFGGGLKIEISNMFTSFGSGSSNAIKSRLAVSFYPENHTEKEFSGVIVLDQSMYGSSTYGTVRILVNNEEVFSTGKVDGSCEKSFPFSIDIRGVSTIVFEADVVLQGSSFIYGIVDSQ